MTKTSSCNNKKRIQKVTSVFKFSKISQICQKKRAGSFGTYKSAYRKTVALGYFQ